MEKHIELKKALLDLGYGDMPNCRMHSDALETASKGDGACYIEIVTDRYAASPLAEKLHENVRTFYPA